MLLGLLSDPEGQLEIGFKQYFLGLKKNIFQKPWLEGTSSYHTQRETLFIANSGGRCRTQTQELGSSVLPSRAALPLPSSHRGAVTAPKAAPRAERTLSMHYDPLH